MHKKNLLPAIPSLSSRLVSGLLAVAAAAVALPAQSADTIPVKMTGWQFGSEDFRVKDNNGTAGTADDWNKVVGTGEFKGTVGGLGTGYSNLSANGSFLSYCIDLKQSFSFNTAYQYDAVYSAQSVFGAAKADALGRFYTAYAGSVKDTGTSAAFQLGLWEITRETSATYNLGGGSLLALSDVTLTDSSSTGLRTEFGRDGAIVAQTNTWLGSLGGVRSQYDISVLFDSSRQDFLLASPATLAPVPEPETYAMLLAGLGVMGAVARRRKQATAG